MKLKIVILDGAYENWDSPQVREMFCSMVSLKLSGYGAQYRKGLIPVGDSDFVAIHKLVCEEKDGMLIPLIGNHTTTMGCAKFHNFMFPALGLASSSGSGAHIEVTKSIMDRCERENRVLGYDAGWTITPDSKNDRELALKLHRAFRAMKAFFIRDYGIDELITGGTVRFKVEKMCQFWGYKPYELNGDRLGEINVRRFDDEPVMLLHMKELAESALVESAEFKELWDTRLTLGYDSIRRLDVAA